MIKMMFLLFASFLMCAFFSFFYCAHFHTQINLTQFGVAYLITLGISYKIMY